MLAVESGLTSCQRFSKSRSVWSKRYKFGSCSDSSRAARELLAWGWLSWIESGCWGTSSLWSTNLDYQDACVWFWWLTTGFQTTDSIYVVENCGLLMTDCVILLLDNEDSVHLSGHLLVFTLMLVTVRIGCVYGVTLLYSQLILDRSDRNMLKSILLPNLLSLTLYQKFLKLFKLIFKSYISFRLFRCLVFTSFRKFSYRKFLLNFWFKIKSLLA